MVGSTTWFVVASAILIGTVLSIRIVANVLARWEESRIVILGIAVLFLVLLIGLALLWQIPVLIRADGAVVARLAGERNAGVTAVMSIITTMGDVVPCFMIAGALALPLLLRGERWFLPLILPAVVLVELVVQFAFGNLFHVEITNVEAALSIGGSGPLPSGSTARLLSLFLVATLIWRGRDDRIAQRLTGLGAILVMVEIISRLYLGRHLLADIAGGLLLGISLTLGVAWLLSMTGRPAPLQIHVK